MLKATLLGGDLVRVPEMAHSPSKRPGDLG